MIDNVRTCKHAWPFIDPVPETVPNYYDLITEPMDLKTLRDKIEFREYKSLIEVEKDFKLIINNCENYNGPSNVYTKMSYKLWKVFRKNVLLFMQRDLHYDESETFMYPPVPVKTKPEPEETRVRNISNHGRYEVESTEDEPMDLQPLNHDKCIHQENLEAIVGETLCEIIDQLSYIQENGKNSHYDEPMCHLDDDEEPRAPTPEPLKTP